MSELMTITDRDDLGARGEHRGRRVRDEAGRELRRRWRYASAIQAARAVDAGRGRSPGFEAG